MKRLFILSAWVLTLFVTSGFELIRDRYVSPEHICIDKGRKTIYIGLATSPGVAVYDIESSKITKIIPMPSPVSGVAVDVGKNILYACSRGDEGKLYVYNLEKGKAENEIDTGYGPEGLAISEKDHLLFVANRFSNDVSVIDLNKQKEINRVKVTREPVSLSVSPDGNTVAVANLLPSQASTSKYISANVSLIDIENNYKVKNVGLPNGSYALKDIVFSPDGKFIYVTHLIGRYNVLTNQIEKGWINTNALSILNVDKQELYTTVLLDDIYKGAANPCGINITENSKKLYVAISGTHELFVIDRGEMHRRIEDTKGIEQVSQSTTPVSGNGNKIKLFEPSSKIGPVNTMFKDIPNELSFLFPVRERVKLNGKVPSYLVSEGDNIYITSYFSDGMDVVNIKNEIISTAFVKIGSRDISLSASRYGEMLFHNAENCFQQWQSCASCHPGNGRVDGLNWDLMNDGIGNPKNTKNLLFAHSTPPAMATGIREDAEIGVRAGFKYIQFFNVPENDAQAVDEYLKSLRPVASPYLVNGKLSKFAQRGKRLFEARNCNQCHSGQFYTDFQQYEIGTKGKYDKQNRWDTPTLLELWRTAPYLHDGRYNSLEDVFKIENHGIYEPFSDIELTELTEYLLSL